MPCLSRDWESQAAVLGGKVSKEDCVLGLSTKVSLTAQCDVGLVEAWERFVPVDLAKVFPKPQGPIPNVVDVRDQSGTWDIVGQTRSVVLSDGMVVTEEITESDPSHGSLPSGNTAHFGYRVSGFTGPLGWLTDEARGTWDFREDNGKTRIEWQYTFNARFALAKPVLSVIVTVFWRRFMNEGLRNVVQILERQE